MTLSTVNKNWSMILEILVNRLFSRVRNPRQGNRNIAVESQSARLWRNVRESSDCWSDAESASLVTDETDSDEASSLQLWCDT